MEENKYLYPGEDVKPVEVGDGYQDYWLSDVLKPFGGFVKFAKAGCGWDDHRVRCEVKIGGDGNDGALFWHGYMESGHAVHPDASRFLREETNYFTDLRLRYYRCGFPVVVAARHVWDYELEHTHVDAFVDLLTGKHYKVVTPK